MCIVSDKIKFCTCTNGEVDELPHYWLFHRFNKDKDEFVIGEPRMPLSYYEPYFTINKKTFAQRLNETDAFDIPLHPGDSDKLVIVLNNTSANESERMTFCFSYEKGNWIMDDYDFFELVNHYDELKFGKFKHMEKEK